jgi:hypothetical protein
MGGAHPLSNGRTIAWLPTGRDTWQVTKKRNEEVLETSVVSLAGNTLSSATRGKLPDGSPFERTVTYRRSGRGNGKVGSPKHVSASLLRWRPRPKRLGFGSRSECFYGLIVGVAPTPEARIHSNVNHVATTQARPIRLRSADPHGEHTAPKSPARMAPPAAAVLRGWDATWPCWAHLRIRMDPMKGSATRCPNRTEGILSTRRSRSAPLAITRAPDPHACQTVAQVQPAGSPVQGPDASPLASAAS